MSEQAFVYTCTGTEGASFMVTLPVAQPDDGYYVTAALAGVAGTFVIDLPDSSSGDRTTTELKVETTAPVQSGDQIEFHVYDTQVTRVGAATGGAGPQTTFQRLTAAASTITTTTATVVMTTTGVGTGLWEFEYLVVYQSGATTNGLGISVNHTGTTDFFIMNWHHVTDGTAASTGIADGAVSTIAGQLVEGKAERVVNSASSRSAGVDTVNANCLAIVKGVTNVTASGNLTLKVSSATASGITVQANTLLKLNKIS